LLRPRQAGINSISGLALAGVLLMTLAGAPAFDETKYPDWSGQWRKPQGIGNQWDQTKPPGRAQQAPLTAEYQAIFEPSLADQAAGGQGEDIRITCVSTGMPRMMTAVTVRVRDHAPRHLHQFREQPTAPHLYRWPAS
jgi:hypothetical protein